MNNVNSNISSNKGFTLIEIIATIIIMGILSAFFIHFMGTALDDSWKSVELVAGEAEAEGKLEEIKAYIDEHKIDMIVFDDDLTPSQVRNIDRMLEIKVLDRSGIILHIFSESARTAQAMAQV